MLAGGREGSYIRLNKLWRDMKSIYIYWVRVSRQFYKNVIVLNSQSQISSKYCLFKGKISFGFATLNFFDSVQPQISESLPSNASKILLIIILIFAVIFF